MDYSDKFDRDIIEYYRYYYGQEIIRAIRIPQHENFCNVLFFIIGKEVKRIIV